MYLPRRHSRRLLLPPGWVALGLLLLLGCQALLTHWRQMRLPNVMQLQMPPWKPSEGKFWGVPVYGSKAELNNFRPWHDAEFTGAPINDFVNDAFTETAVKAIQADTSQAGGMRIRFGRHATYSNLIKVLDMMNYLNQKRYWLDIRHNPITLYAITNKPLPASAYVPVFTCGYSSYVESYTTPPAEPAFWQKLTDLWQRDWRPSALLFAAIISLNCYQVARPRPSLR
jgi:hypothetical protein